MKNEQMTFLKYAPHHSRTQYRQSPHHVHLLLVAHLRSLLRWPSYLAHHPSRLRRKCGYSTQDGNHPSEPPLGLVADEVSQRIPLELDLKKLTLHG
jgi:hypothetical protein